MEKTIVRTILKYNLILCLKLNALVVFVSKVQFAVAVFFTYVHCMYVYKLNKTKLDANMYQTAWPLKCNEMHSVAAQSFNSHCGRDVWKKGTYYDKTLIFL